MDPIGEPVSGVLVKVQEGQGAAINKTTDDTGLLEHVIDVGERISNIQVRARTAAHSVGYICIINSQESFFQYCLPL